MSEKVEGTIVVEGIVEGRVPVDDGGEDRLRQWVLFAGSAGLPLSLEIEGDSFSVLGEGWPQSVQALGADASGAIADLLRELMKILSKDDYSRVFSTLRSTEYRRGAEVQSLYLISRHGDVDVRQRTIDSRTVPAPRTLTRRDKVRLGAMALGAVAISVGISAFFVDYRRLLGDFLQAAAPLDPASVHVEATLFERYFKVDKKATGAGGRTLELTLRRTPAFPLTESDLGTLYGAELTVAGRLALEAVALGYVRCELFGEGGRFLGFTMARIRGLKDSETTTIALPVPSGERTGRVVVTY